MHKIPMQQLLTPAPAVLDLEALKVRFVFNCFYESHLCVPKRLNGNKVRCGQACGPSRRLR